MRLPCYGPLSSAGTGSLHETWLKVRLARLRLEGEVKRHKTGMSSSRHKEFSVSKHIYLLCIDLLIFSRCNAMQDFWESPRQLNQEARPLSWVPMSWSPKPTTKSFGIIKKKTQIKTILSSQEKKGTLTNGATHVKQLTMTL